MTDELDDGEGTDRWYLVVPEQDLVAYGPDSKAACNSIADELDIPYDATLIDRNGLLGFEWSRGSEFTYGEHATPPDDVEGGLFGELLEAAISDNGGDSAGDSA